LTLPSSSLAGYVHQVRPCRLIAIPPYPFRLLFLLFPVPFDTSLALTLPLSFHSHDLLSHDVPQDKQSFTFTKKGQKYYEDHYEASDGE
jgi:hypothetical protein